MVKKLSRFVFLGKKCFVYQGAFISTFNTSFSLQNNRWEIHSKGHLLKKKKSKDSNQTQVWYDEFI